jgi:hypothetical protein
MQRAQLFVFVCLQSCVHTSRQVAAVSGSSTVVCARAQQLTGGVWQFPRCQQYVTVDRMDVPGSESKVLPEILLLMYGKEFKPCFDHTLPAACCSGWLLHVCMQHLHTLWSRTCLCCHCSLGAAGKELTG